MDISGSLFEILSYNWLKTIEPRHRGSEGTQAPQEGLSEPLTENELSQTKDPPAAERRANTRVRLDGV
jgi:hypothetical protein